MHKIFCIIGRTGVGKSVITNKAVQRLQMKILKSYTTRSMRNGETIEKSDHTFIKPDEVEQYRNDMVAYTDRVGYCSFATRQQLFNSDFYIINPTGLYELKLKTKDMDIELIPVYINVPYRQNLENAKKRGDLESWKANYEKENDEFKSFEYSDLVRYRILNNGTIDQAVDKLVRIVEKEREGIKHFECNFNKR